MPHPALVIDPGSSVIKAGFAGNRTPSCVWAWSRPEGPIEDLYHDLFFTRLRVEPEHHAVLIAEPATSASPEQREALAEVGHGFGPYGIVGTAPMAPARPFHVGFWG